MARNSLIAPISQPAYQYESLWQATQYNTYSIKRGQQPMRKVLPLLPLASPYLLWLLCLAQSALVISPTPGNTLAQADYSVSGTFPSTTIPAGSQPVLAFSTRFLINSSSLTACQYSQTGSSSFSAATCTVISNSSGYFVTFGGVYVSQALGQSSLDLKFTAFNPWASTTETVTLSITSASSTLVTTSGSYFFQSSSLSGCGWVSSSQANGAASTRTISFTPSQKVLAGSSLSISLPFWFASTPSLIGASPTCASIANVNSGISCSSSSSGSTELLRASNLFANNQTLSSAVSFNISSLANPWSTSPFGPITFSLVSTSNSQEYVSQTCSSILQTTTLLGALQSFRFSYSRVIGQSFFFRNGWFKITNPLPSQGGEVHITLSGGISLTYTGSFNPTLGSATNSSYLVLDSFQSDYYPNSNISLFAKFSGQMPPSSRPFTITVTTYLNSAGTTYGIDTLSVTESCPAGALTCALSLANSSIGASTSLTLSVTTSNSLFTGSFIGVTFPPSLTAASPCSTNNSNILCSVTASGYANLTVSGLVAGGVTILITFSSVQNPGQAGLTASFQVVTYLDNLLDAVIDQVLSGLTLEFGASQLSPSSVFVLPSNLTTSSPSNYTISAALNNFIPAGGSILLVFPPELTLATPSLLSASFPTTSCSLSLLSNNLTLDGCFPTELSTLNIYFTIGGVTNPSSLAPTSSFEIYTQSTNGTINFLNSGVSVTMTSLALSHAFTASAGSQLVNQATTYTFGLTFFGSPSTGDYLLLSLPAGMGLAGTPSCTPLSGVAAIDCSGSNSTHLSILMVAVPAPSISFSVASIQNFQVSGSQVDLQMTAYNSNNFATEQTPVSSLSFTPTFLTATTNNDDQIALSEPSNVTLTITVPFALDSALNSSLTSIQIALPSDILPLSNTSCTSGGLSCSLSGTNFTLLSPGLSVSGLAVVLSNVLLNFATGPSSSFALQYTYNSGVVGALSSGVTVNGFCSSPCQRCNITASACLSCLPNPNPLTLHFSPNSSCLSSCPTGYFLSASTCEVCSPNCSTCNSSLTCQTCAPSFFFYNLTCLSSCPDGTFLSGSSCSACDPNCLTCSSSAANCQSCPSPTLLSGSSCVSSCPNGTYNSSGTCVACVTNCDTCNATSNLCSVCASTYYLYLGQCYLNCPAAAPVPDTSTQQCSACGSTCGSCSTDGSFCNACNSGYLSLSGLCYSSCPDGYQATNSTCTEIIIIRTVYYPVSITSCSLLLLVLLSRWLQPSSDVSGNSVAIVSVGALVSTSILAATTQLDHTLPARLLSVEPSHSVLLAVAVGILGVSLVLGTSFVVFLNCKLGRDPALKLWRERSRTNNFMFHLIGIASCVRVAVLRLLYCRFFGRECFCCYVRSNSYFLKVCNWFSFAALLLCSAPSIALALIFILNGLGDSQTQIYAIDLLVLSSLEAILLIVDMCLKDKSHFTAIIQSLPYLRKFKKYQDFSSSDGSLISINQPEDQHPKTEADRDPRLPLGHFGAFNETQSIDPNPIISKTLPEFNSLNAEVHFDPFEEKKKSDELFFQEREYNRQFNQLKESYQREEQFSPSEEEKTQQELHPQKTVQEIINERPKELNPAEFLHQLNSEDSRDIDQQQLSLLNKIAERKGVSAQALKNLFGCQKHYNPALLEGTLNHDQVSSQAVEHLVGPSNNSNAIQTIFGRDSSIQSQKLRKILADPKNKELVDALFGKDSGLLSIDALKTLLSSFSSQFISQLLTASQIDRQKLKILLQENTESQVNGLSALRAIGGEDLEKKETLSNTIGSEAELDPTLIPKVAREMSQKSIKTVFQKRSPSNSTLIRNVINNKNVPLEPLNPIQEMPEIVQEFAELLNCGNQEVEENLNSLLEEGNYEGEALKELLVQGGKGEEQMKQLLSYLSPPQKQQPPENGEGNGEDWPSTPNLQEIHSDQTEEINYLDFDQEEQIKYRQAEDKGAADLSRGRPRVRVKRKDLPEVHLPSEHIYLQRLQGTRDIGKKRKRNIRVKQKPERIAGRFMDEENQIYDLDF